MSSPIALQLYSIREVLEKDYQAGIEAIAAMGYRGVETAGFPGTTAAEAGRLFKKLGLDVPAAHSAMPLGEQKESSLDAACECGAKRLISGFGADRFATLDGVRQSCDQFNEAFANCRERGLPFGIHNHWWEFGKVEGKLVLDLMIERLEPGVFFEIDTYWARTAGSDPAAVVKRLGKRAPLLHLKDGPFIIEEPMTALGEGKMDFAPIVEASRGNAEWLIVELDRCATDMMEAVRKSYFYLTGKGWAHGTR
jgi:sugar phosphate isomerase/epimerase